MRKDRPRSWYFTVPPCINYMQYPWGYAAPVRICITRESIISTRESYPQYPWGYAVPVSHILSTREDMQYPWVILDSFEQASEIKCSKLVTKYEKQTRLIYSLLYDHSNFCRTSAQNFPKLCFSRIWTENGFLTTFWLFRKPFRAFPKILELYDASFRKYCCRCTSDFRWVLIKALESVKLL